MLRCLPLLNLLAVLAACEPVQTGGRGQGGYEPDPCQEGEVISRCDDGPPVLGRSDAEEMPVQLCSWYVDCVEVYAVYEEYSWRCIRVADGADFDPEQPVVLEADGEDDRGRATFEDWSVLLDTSACGPWDRDANHRLTVYGRACGQECWPYWGSHHFTLRYPVAEVPDDDDSAAELPWGGEGGGAYGDEGWVCGTQGGAGCAAAGAGGAGRSVLWLLLSVGLGRAISGAGGDGASGRPD